MPANLVSAVVVGRLLEDRYRLERRDAFLYALVPQLAGMPEAPAIAVSIALGRRNEPPPPVADRADDESKGDVADQPGAVTGPPRRELPQRELVTVPDVTGRSHAEAISVIRDAGLAAQPDKVTNGTVTAQEPEGGNDVERGSTVVLRVKS